MVLLVLLLAGGAAAWLLMSGGADITEVRPSPEGAPFGAGEPWSDEAAAVPISSDDPTWGSRTAPATLVVFTDFQCPFCARLAKTISTLKSKYGAAELRVVHKHFPLDFHKNAKPAHIASEVVFRLGGPSAFWKFHDLAFDSGRELSESNLYEWAKLAGVDATAFRNGLDAPQHRAKVERDIKTGRELGIRGTPQSFVNGVRVSGAQPADKLSSIIDEQLAAARAERNLGTAPDQIYVKLCNRNFDKSAAGKPAGEKKDESEKKEPDDPNEVWAIPVGADDPVKGPANALVTIVELSEFQCPFCKRVQPTLDEVLSTYAGKVRLVWKDNPLPFHQQADEAATLAREARAQKGDQGFWLAHDKLYANQTDLSDDALLRYAAELGLSIPALTDALAKNKHRVAIEAGMDLASDFQARGTPTFFINGRKLRGAQPYDRFRELIEEELPKAQRLLATGVAPSALYAKLVENGRGPKVLERVTVAPPPPNAPWRGTKNARVVIQEFADFQCPFCKRVDPILERVLEEYSGKVKLVWRHKPLPMHKQAALAAEAAQEAMVQKGNQAFWAYHDKLLANQTEQGLGRPMLERYAEEIGLDMTRFKRALDGGTHQPFVAADGRASEAAGITGTPTFVVGGYLLKGAQPFNAFRRAIEEALKDG